MNGLLKQKKAVIALGAVGGVALLAAAWFLVVYTAEVEGGRSRPSGGRGAE